MTEEYILAHINLDMQMDKSHYILQHFLPLPFGIEAWKTIF